VRCIWCDEPNHKCSDCGSYADALKEGIVFFREDRIRDVTTDECRALICRAKMTSC
jgi:hypothetical protein